MALTVGTSYVLSGAYTGTAPTGGQYAFDSSTTFSDMAAFSINTTALTWQGTITLPAAGAHQVRVRKTNLPSVVSSLSGSFTVLASSGGGTPASPTTWTLSAIPTTAALATPQRRALHAATSWGVCGSLVDASNDQYAAGLTYINCTLVRGNYVGSNFDLLPTITTLRTKMQALGSKVSPLKALGLPMAYISQPRMFTDQQAAFIGSAQRGELWGIGDWNEINNPEMGKDINGNNGGSRGANDTINKTGYPAWTQNYSDLAQVTYNFLVANSDTFKGVLHLAPNALIYDQGTGNTNSGSLPDVANYVDYGTWHCYPGAGRQPTFEGGDIINTGNWVRAAAVRGLRHMVLTETGASTLNDGSFSNYGFARQGNSAAKFTLNVFADVFRMNGRALFYYQLFDGGGNVGNYEGNLGFYYADKVTPKPQATAMKRLTSLLYLGNDPANAANATAPTTYVPGINAAKLGVSGLTPAPRSGDGWLVLDKADGSAMVLLWNEPQIDDGNGHEVTPSVNNVTLTFASSRSYRVHDPLGTASLTTGTFTQGTSVVVPLYGYVKVVEVAPPTGYTTAGGDPADVAPTGSGTFGIKQYGIAETLVDSGECTVAAPNTMTPGNTMLCYLFNDPGNNPQGPAGATKIATYARSGTNNQCCTTIWTVPITNAAQTFRFTGMQTWSAIAWAEVKAGNIAPYGGDATLNNANSSSTTFSISGPAIPSGSIGLGTFEIQYSPDTVYNTTGAASLGEVTVLKTQTPTKANVSGLYRFSWLFSLPSRSAGTVTSSIPYSYGDNSSEAVGTIVVLSP